MSGLKAASLDVTGISLSLTPLHWIVTVFAVSTMTCVPAFAGIALKGDAMPIRSASAALAAELMSLTYAQYVAALALRNTSTSLFPSGDTKVAAVPAALARGATAMSKTIKEMMIRDIVYRGASISGLPASSKQVSAIAKIPAAIIMANSCQWFILRSTHSQRVTATGPT